MYTAPGYWDRAVVQSDHGSQWSADNADQFAKMVLKNAPHCELGTRLTVSASKNSTPEQLAEWESAITYDAKTMTAIGKRYQELDQPEDALRCLEKAMKMMPETATAFPLADAYFAEGKFKQWKEVLNDLKDNPFPGLGRTRVEVKLAKGFLTRGLWEQAPTPANAAGESYSAWGMKLASRVEEALSDWKLPKDGFDKQVNLIQRAAVIFGTSGAKVPGAEILSKRSLWPRRTLTTHRNRVPHDSIAR